MSGLALALFVKTPGVSPVKTRLAADIGKRKALQLYRACIAVAEELGDVAQGLGITVYWAIAEGVANAPYWPQRTVIGQGEGDLGQRMAHVLNLLRRRHSAVMLLGADAPQVSQADLQQAQKILSSASAQLIGPASDGGFWTYGSTLQADATAWSGVGYSAPDTRAQFVATLPPGVALTTLRTLTDIDDLATLRQCLDQLRGQSLRPQQQALCKLLEALAS